MNNTHRVWKTTHLPPIDCDVDESDNPLTCYLPVGYDGNIVDDVFAVMSALSAERGLYYTDIAERFGYDPKYVHLMLEVLAYHEMTEYGTSPRGSWLTDAGSELLDLATRFRDGQSLEFVEVASS